MKNAVYSRYIEHIRTLHDSILKSSGETTSQLRTAVGIASARLSGSAGGEAEVLPLALEHYVRKVALHAYRITDKDIENLRAAGWSDEALFELTISAALGAGMARLNVGLAALKGSGDAH